jgi:hypothetical protein
MVDLGFPDGNVFEFSKSRSASTIVVCLSESMVSRGQLTKVETTIVGFEIEYRGWNSSKAGSRLPSTSYISEFYE